MKITDVRVMVTCPRINYVIVKIVTEDGLYGIGEGTLMGSELAVARVIEHAAPLLVGRDPQQIEDTWHFLHHHTYWRDGAIHKSALAAIDIALWDLKAKRAGMPLYQLLGGPVRDGVLVYGHAGGKTPPEVADSIRAFQAKGFEVIRAQMGPYGGAGVLGHDAPLRASIPGVTRFEPALMVIETPKLFEFLRRELGEQVELLHDLHEQLRPVEALHVAKALAPYRLFYLEDALMPENKEAFRQLRAACSTPLAIGELFASRWDCLPLFVDRLIDYIRITPIHVGGITEAKKICVWAEPFEIKTAFHGAADIGPVGQAAALHLQRTLLNFGIQEWTEFRNDALMVDLFPGLAERRGACAYVGETPGHGVDISEELAARYPYQHRYHPLVRRKDGTPHRY